MRFLRSPKFFCLFTIFTALLAGALVLLCHTDEDQRFTQLADRIFRSEMTANTLSMHYTISDPARFGIQDYTPSLPCYSAQGSELAARSLEQDLQDLDRISPESLSPDNRSTYELLYSYLEQALEANSFPYYEEPLSPASGMQSQLPILLAEYTFRTVSDVEDYLALLDQTDEYFASLVLYEQEKKAAGLLQADTSLAQVMEQCTTILSKKELENGTHFLQTTFEERTNTLVQQGLLTTAQACSYSSENDRLLTTVMQPAYENLADELFLLMGDGTSRPQGLAAYPEGQAYYAHLVQSVTGSSKAPEEIKDLLYPMFETEYQALQELLRSRQDAIHVWQMSLDSGSFPGLTPEEMLTDLQSRMAPSFPAFPDGTVPSVVVKQVSSSLAEYCAPAFYLTPPFDDADSNVIYINPASTAEGLELYTTLGHEGYPGHLYQTVYDSQNRLLQGTHPVRQLLWYGGYQEGWALYVESLCYDYAIALANEQGMPDTAFAWEIEKHNRSMQLCLYSLLDVSIHYDNASYEKVHQVLETFGITDPETTRIIYDYVAQEPASYLKYYLGYLEILALREKAMDLWQADYSDLRFHQFFLDFGPADFDTLTDALAPLDP